MSEADPKRLAQDAFRAHFGLEPEAASSAPGRVNLLGEHTDYNGGVVLPMALDGLGVGVAIGQGTAPGRVDLHSSTFGASRTRDIAENRIGDWSDYALGCLQSVARDEIAATGIRIALATTVPMGAGLSSSAALEVATLRAAAQFFGRDSDPVSIAIAARAVENRFVGMPCGIMDQFASSVGTPGMALFLDTRSLNHAAAPALAGHHFVIVDSGVSHQLTEDGYATRVAECQKACQLLDVEMLSDLSVDDLPRLETLAEPYNRRARHIVTENQRTRDGLTALQDNDSGLFGRLMLESHASQRDDYAIVVTETDAIVERAMALGACGARQTGGGFGGSVVALVPEGQIAGFTGKIVGSSGQGRVLAIV